MINQLVESALLTKRDLRISFLKYFVDDFLLVVHKNDVDKILEHFNNIHPRIQFEREIEIDSKLPFLDTKIIRDGNKLITDLYKKASSSNRILNFNSHAPISHKKSIVKSIKNKIIKLSEKKFHEQSFNKETSILIQNKYPKQFIRNIFQNYNNTERQKTEYKYFKFPYIGTILNKSFATLPSINYLRKV